MNPRPRHFLVLGVVTLAVLAPLTGYEFTNWDDGHTVAHNPRLNPPSWGSVAHYWAHPHVGLYVPVTYTIWNALAAVARLDAPDPAGVQLNPWIFHGFNLLVHAASAGLVLVLLNLLFDDGAAPGRAPAAPLLGALLFALHPVQVETVAWVSGGKDLFCGFFALLSLWQYLLYARSAPPGDGASPAADPSPPRRRRLHYAFGLAAMLVGMLCKPTAMVVPGIAFVLDVCLVRRAPRRALRDLLPWVLAALPLMVVARLVQEAPELERVPAWDRPFVAGFALAFYAGKLLAPVHLSFDYGWRPQVLIGKPWFYAAWLVPAAIALIAWLSRRRAPGVWAGALVFAIGIAPVAGFTTFMFQFISTVADHYLYLSMFGAALALTALLRAVPAPGPRRAATAAATAVATAAVAALAVRSFVQTGVWRDSISLNSHIVAVNPASFSGFNNLGTAWARRGDVLAADRDLDGAREAYLAAADALRSALNLVPGRSATLKNLTTALASAALIEPDPELRRRRTQEADAQLEAYARSTDPVTPPTPPEVESLRVSIGDLHAASGDWEAAVQRYERALAEFPDSRELAEKLADARRQRAAQPAHPPTPPNR